MVVRTCLKVALIGLHDRFGSFIKGTATCVHTAKIVLGMVQVRTPEWMFSMLFQEYLFWTKMRNEIR
jgi:hypothetical protein